MRVIKFEFLYKGLPFSSKSDKFNWHKKRYTLDQLIEKPLSKLSDIHFICELVAKRQFIGLQDINGKDIYEGDVLHQLDPLVWNPFVVSYCENTSCYLAGGTITRNSIVESELIIVGNIYENPNILDGELK